MLVEGVKFMSGQYEQNEQYVSYNVYSASSNLFNYLLIQYTSNTWHTIHRIIPLQTFYNETETQSRLRGGQTDLFLEQYIFLSIDSSLEYRVPHQT